MLICAAKHFSYVFLLDLAKTKLHIFLVFYLNTKDYCIQQAKPQFAANSPPQAQGQATEISQDVFSHISEHISYIIVLNLRLGKKPHPLETSLILYATYITEKEWNSWCRGIHSRLPLATIQLLSLTVDMLSDLAEKPLHHLWGLFWEIQLTLYRWNYLGPHTTNPHSEPAGIAQSVEYWALGHEVMVSNLPTIPEVTLSSHSSS